MKNFLGQLSPRSLYVFALIAGLALAAAFPKMSLAGLAWVAPALMLASAHGKSGGDTFRTGYVAGLAFWLASLYWLLLIPFRWLGIPFGPALGWMALSAYLALYPAMWVWIVSRVPGVPDSWFRRSGWALSGAAAWVALEMIRARLFGGFPWNFIGSSQYQLTPLIQIASATGVYGVSFLVVWTSLALFSAAREILRQPANRHAWLGEIILPLASLVAVFAFGLGRLRERSGGGPTLRVTFIQPAIPQTMIWDDAAADQRFDELLQLTQLALTNHPDLLLWPEAAVPHKLRYDEPTLLAVTALAQSNHLWIILGSDDKEPARHPRHEGEADYFNASFLVAPNGALAQRYCKRNLVIFGEYVPFSRALPFLKWLSGSSDASDFSPGDKPETFVLDRGAPVRTSTLICFEDTFPHLVREYAEADTDFLVNLTNDGWFGESAAQWQHASGAVFRAVENGLPLLRCCNNGLTCWIDARGRLRETLRDPTGSEYGAGVLTAQIPVLAPDELRARTFYNRRGDWFGWTCVALTGAAVVNSKLKKPKRKTIT